MSPIRNSQNDARTRGNMIINAHKIKKEIDQMERRVFKLTRHIEDNKSTIAFYEDRIKKLNHALKNEKRMSYVKTKHGSAPVS